MTVEAVRTSTYASCVAALASFVRFVLDFSAGSGDLSDAERGQFTETRTLDPAEPLGYYSMHVMEMKDGSGTFTTKERGMYGIHWINLTAGEVDRTWTSADYAAVEGAVETFWTAMAALTPSEFRLVEHRWYAFGPQVFPPNPPSRVTTLGTPKVGTATGGSPHQLSTTITLRTALRKHWGRFYYPLAAAQLTAGGQLTTSNVDSFANAAKTKLMVTPSAQGVIPVVWDRNKKIAFGVTAIECDSVPDIQRPRRPRDAAYKKILTS